MKNRYIPVKLESNDATKDPISKVVILKGGKSYERLLGEIQERFKIQCDPCSMKVMHKPKISEDRLIEITDGYDLNAYFGLLDSGLTSLN